MKIGFLSLPLTRHLNPMAALARKLQSRGHEVAFIGVPDIEAVVRATDLDFVPFCENEYPPGPLARNVAGLRIVRKGFYPDARTQVVYPVLGVSFPARSTRFKR